MLVGTNKKENKKLIPLRRIAEEGLYSSAYLSLLVQRKKLKAKKVGRNYFTTREWFNDYLEAHARDEKRSIATEVKVEDRKETKVEEKKQEEISLKPLSENAKTETVVVVENIKKNSPKKALKTVTPKAPKIYKKRAVRKTKKQKGFLAKLFTFFFISPLKLSVVFLMAIFALSFKAIFYFAKPFGRFSVVVLKKIDKRLQKKINKYILKFSYAGISIALLFFVFGNLAPNTSAKFWQIVDNGKAGVARKLENTFLGEMVKNEKVANLLDGIRRRNNILKNRFSFVTTYWSDSYNENIKPEIEQGYEKVKLKIEPTQQKVASSLDAQTENKIIKPFQFIKDKFFAFLGGLKNASKKTFVMLQKPFVSDENMRISKATQEGKVAGASEVNLESMSGDSKSASSNEDGILKSLSKKVKNLFEFLSDNYDVALGVMNPVEVDEGGRGVYAIKKEEEKEGVVVVPFDDDEEAEQIKEKIETMFSDDVIVSPDDSGRAGVVKPVFGAKEADQKYLYMMVPLSEEDN